MRGCPLWVGSVMSWIDVVPFGACVHGASAAGEFEQVGMDEGDVAADRWFVRRTRLRLPAVLVASATESLRHRARGQTWLILSLPTAPTFV